MELADVIGRRHMVRSFRDEPLPDGALDRILEAARRAPSAGNTQGTELVVLEGPEETATYWDICLPADRRGTFRWPDLLAAPVLIVPLAAPGAYLARYAEPDKDGTGLGRSAADWPVPYWDIDAGFAAMLMLLTAVDLGLGALFFGIFDHERELLDRLGVPDELHAVGTVAVGQPASDRPGRSASRVRRTLGEVVHRGRW